MTRFAAFSLLVVASPALAEVKSSSEAGLEVSHSVVVSAAPAEAYAAIGRIGQWWNSAHSYSSDAGNMTLPLQIGGCFCEKLPNDGGEVEHGRVTYAQPGVMLRLNAALGPIHQEAATGTLTWTLTPEGAGTRITQSYLVGGYVRGGAARLAAPIDGVMTEALTRLQSHIDAPKPLSKPR